MDRIDAALKLISEALEEDRLMRLRRLASVNDQARRLENSDVVFIAIDDLQGPAKRFVDEIVSLV